MRGANGVTLDLTTEDWEGLLVMLGYATAAAFAEGDRAIGYRFLELGNRLNRDNADFVPYVIPEVKR